MNDLATHVSELRSEAARLSFLLIRFEGQSANEFGRSPDSETRDHYAFLPSWRTVPHNEVEAFLVGLPSPALLVPTTLRRTIALTLLHELTGDRRRGMEKTLSNFGAGLDESARQLDLSQQSRILLEFDNESHIFSFAVVYEWSQHLPVQVGWSIGPLKNDDRADACIQLMPSDRRMFEGRSCVIRPGWRPRQPGEGAT